LQKFAAVHSSVFTHFNQERSLASRHIFKQNRSAALAEWRRLGVAEGERYRPNTDEFEFVWQHPPKHAYRHERRSMTHA
jgi:hypothetical protein